MSDSKLLSSLKGKAEELIQAFDKGKGLKEMVDDTINNFDKLFKASTKYLKEQGVKLKDIAKTDYKEATKDDQEGFLSRLTNSFKDGYGKGSESDLPVSALEDPEDVQDQADKESRRRMRAASPPSGDDDFEHRDESTLAKLLGSIGSVGGTVQDKWTKLSNDRAKRRQAQIAKSKQGLWSKLKGVKKGPLGFLGKLLSGLTLAIFGPIKWATKLLMSGIWKVTWWSAKTILKYSGKLLWGATKMFGRGIWSSMKWLDGKFGGHIGRMIGSLSTKLGDLGVKIVSGLGEKIGALGKFLKGGGIKGLFSSAAGWVASKGGIVGAAKFVGSTALQVGARVFSFSNPLGWIILAGTALWAGYKLYKYLSKKNGDLPNDLPGNVTRLRFLTYGVNKDNRTNYKKILEIEEVTGPFFRYDQNSRTAIYVNQDHELQQRVYETLGLDGADQDRDARYLEWYKKRFLPAYQEFLTCLWTIDPDLKPGQIDELTRNDFASLVYDFNCPESVWKIRVLPFEDTPLSTTSKGEYEEMLVYLKNELEGEMAKINEALANEDAESMSRKNTNNSLRNKNKKAAEDAMNGIKSSSGGGYGSSGFDPNNINEDGSTKGIGEGAYAALFNAGKGMTLRSLTGGGGGTSWENPADFKVNEQMGSSVLTSNMNFGYKQGAGNMELHDATGVGADRSIDEALYEAAQVTGVPEEVLWTFAKIESSLRPKNYNSKTGAAGLFQFLQSTWDDEMKSTGKKYGLQKTNQFNSYASAIMAAEYIKKNLSSIEKWQSIGVDYGVAAYLAHFLGNAGSIRLFDSYVQNPENSMLTATTQAKIDANKELMLGATVGQFLNRVTNKWMAAVNTPVNKYSGYIMDRAKHPEASQKFTPHVLMKFKGKETEVRNLAGERADAEAAERSGIVGSDGMATQEAPQPFDPLGGSNFEAFQNSIGSGAKSGSGLVFSEDGEVASNGVVSTGGGFTNRGPHDTKPGDGSRYNMVATSIGSVSNEFGGIGRMGGLPMNAPVGENPPVRGGNTVGDAMRDGSLGMDPNAPAVTCHPIAPGHQFCFTSLIGRRKSVGSSNHKGIDIAVPGNKPGTPIVAAGDGVVIWSTFNADFGEVISIYHPHANMQTKYAHLVKGSRTVKVGDQVKAGQLLGYMGNTTSTIKGMKTHLHFEIRFGKSLGKEAAVVNPLNMSVIAKSYHGLNQMTNLVECGLVTEQDIKDGRWVEVQLENSKGAYSDATNTDPNTGISEKGPASSSGNVGSSEGMPLPEAGSGAMAASNAMGEVSSEGNDYSQPMGISGKFNSFMDGVKGKFGEMVDQAEAYQAEQAQETQSSNYAAEEAPAPITAEVDTGKLETKVQDGTNVLKGIYELLKNMKSEDLTGERKITETKDPKSNRLRLDMEPSKVGIDFGAKRNFSK